MLGMQTVRPGATLATMQDVWDYYRADLHGVDVQIRKHVDSDVPLINQVALYILTSGGKRIRPLLLVVSARLMGYDDAMDDMLSLAGVVEYIHAATLLHDDVLDVFDGRDRFGEAPPYIGDYLRRDFRCEFTIIDAVCKERLIDGVSYPLCLELDYPSVPFPYPCWGHLRRFFSGYSKYLWGTDSLATKRILTLFLFCRVEVEGQLPCHL